MSRIYVVAFVVCVVACDASESTNDAGADAAGVMNDAGGDLAGAADSRGSVCPNPAFTTSDPNGGWSDGGYYVHNNMWNASAGLGPETLYACSYHNWYVVSNQTDNAGA